MARAHLPRAGGADESVSTLCFDWLGIRERDAIEATIVARKQQVALSPEHHPQLPAPRPGVFAAQRVGRVIEILHEAVARAAEEREVAHHPVLDQRASDRAFGAEPVVITGREPDAGLERVRRLTSEDVDRPPHRVTAVKRALRAAQHLYA